MNERQAPKSAPTAVQPPSPDGLATPSSSSVTNEPNLPSIAADADNLNAIKKAVDDAAAVGGGLWLSYLFVLFYLAVAAGAVTHVDLFLEKPVKLPFLSIELPLLAFFSLAPILFLFTHGYALVHLVMLTEKAKDYDQALREQIGADTPVSDKLRRQLPSNIFIQYLAGPVDRRKSAFGYALGFIAWTTLAVAPVLLLLMMQLQFLPFHSPFIAWTQRIVLALDLALIWWLWGTIRSGREIESNRGALFWAGRILGLAAGLVLTIGAILFSTAVATFPGEWQEDHLPSVRILPMIQSAMEMELAIKTNDQSRQQRNESVWNSVMTSWDWIRALGKVSFHEWIFNSPLNEITRRRWLPFSNVLVLTGFNVLEGLGIDDPKKEDWRDFVFRARGRDLKGARFDFGSLPGVDFAGASLEGARFDATQLDRTSFREARLQGATLDGAQLQGATLDAAQLQGATLDAAQLQGATLHEAQLQGATLQRAQLQGATLDGAQLQGATLDGAQLQAASLRGIRVDLWMNGEKLQDTSVIVAQLRGASLRDAQLQGASFADANLDAADFSGAFLWRADGDRKSGNDLDLDGAVWGSFWTDFTRTHPSDQKQPWNNDAYQGLRKLMQAVPAGPHHDAVLEQIRRLDCADKALAPCDPAAPPPRPGITGFRAAASVQDYRRTLAGTLKSIVCAGDDDSIFILRGITPPRGDPLRSAGAGRFH